MDSPKKEPSVKRFYELPKSIIEQLNQFCKETMLSRTAVIVLALRKYMKERKI
jgi:metal-responsive CopG/Arc/MetJ family transcriptional regulator